MAKTKEISSKSATFAKGGTTKMFGKQHAGPDRAGETSGTKAGSGGKFAKGGPSGKVGNQRPSISAKSGVSVSN
jgi:hypothetical protein